MRQSVILTCLSLTLSLSLLAREEVSMSAPILQVTPEEISFTTTFSNFVPGGSYRLGVGTTGDKTNSTTIELLKENIVLSKKVVGFEQGFARSWFEVDRIVVRGLLFRSAELPGSGEDLTLKVTLPRAVTCPHNRVHSLC